MVPSKLKLKATPENEDFRGKYETGKYGDILLERYFNAVEKLVIKANLKGKKVHAIEIGCGEGLSTKRLVKIIPRNMTIEASEYVKRQTRYAKENNPGIRITQESIYSLKHRDNSFDLVFLLEVLEHLDYPAQALNELKRVIKPGGYLIIGVPREPIWRGLNMLRGKYWNDWGNTPGHLNHWSSRTLVKYINKNFGPVKAKRNPIPWTLVLVKNT